MHPETSENSGPLRYGYTTGACATAVSLAAATVLLTVQHSTSLETHSTSLETIDIVLPRGQHVTFHLESLRKTANGAESSVIKDAGDDPDVTHGATVRAFVRLSGVSGVRFHAGVGVGTVTRPGLPIPVGEPAINPTPRHMISTHLSELAQRHGYLGGFEVTISIDHGESLAQKTLNSRLGIVGGLSILGTTGIVRPFSCSAYIISIQQAINVAHANGCTHIGACTGAASEQMLRAHYQMPDVALIKMGDFVGAVLKHLRKVPIAQLSISGGFGKISKLAMGHLNLHSAHSHIDPEWLAAQVSALGADLSLQTAIRTANTSQQGLSLAQAAGYPFGDHICALARQQARMILPPEVAVDVWAIDREGQVVGSAPFM